MEILIAEHDPNNILTHEAQWILYSISTRATISPESCDGKFCPFKSYEGLGFSADLHVNKTLPAVSAENVYSTKRWSNIYFGFRFGELCIGEWKIVMIRWSCASKFQYRSFCENVCNIVDHCNHYCIKMKSFCRLLICYMNH